MGQSLASSFVWNMQETPVAVAADEEDADASGDRAGAHTETADDVDEVDGTTMCFPIELACEGAQIPKRATAGAAGYDLVSAENVTLHPGDRTLVNTGVRIMMKDSFNSMLPPDTVVEGAIRGRSGLARKGIDVFNGTVDSDYRGEVKVLMINNSGSLFEFNAGDRIAQIVFSVVLVPRLQRHDDVAALFSTVRGEGHP